MTYPHPAADCASYGTLISGALARYPERTAFVHGPNRWTYRQTAEGISRAIQQLQAWGLRPGDTVAQLSGNRPEVFWLMAAVMMSGLRSTTVHGMASLADHAYILSHCGAKALIADEAHATRAEELRAGSASKLLTAAHDGPHDNFWEAASSYAVQPLQDRTGREDVIRLAYTGGTTGRPKGVMLPNRAMVSNTLLTLIGMGLEEGVQMLLPTPISHGAGSLIVPVLLQGGTVTLQDGFDPEQLIMAIEKDRASATFLVPTMIYKLLDHPSAAQADWSSLKTLIYGAAPMAPARIKQALDLIGPVLLQGYGQTEAPNTILTLSRQDHVEASLERLASAGRPYPGVVVALLDDNDQQVPHGEVGEICVRGPLVMSGYLDDEEQTEEAFRSGWLHTGDIARQDDQGYFYIVDRKKDMIISGGFNVYPKEIENVLTTHPAVAAAAVIGMPDPLWGEAVTALVVLRPAMHVDTDELASLVRQEKGPVGTPKRIYFVEGLPVTALGKYDKKAMKQQLLDADRSDVPSPFAK